ncbi:methylene-tetrahydromethanopterin reductase [Streptomyces inusitatus]|uniref:Methylene-tetrahydromethanopterin reductase n=1 Tax=Streptomyces inusitatus TaxID=68221 RepID=A0A918UUX8_9ACTN|nr:MsnO8 family LLM class oxidoreductase [Streptomyces inusitatus]GGZ37313.1 methylene-tetrahydromethanopterin reductase [Streptomyces inusitatus]
MTSRLASTPLSVLDRSRTREGYDGPAALRDTVRFAQRIEALGYHRFWVAEHHSVPGVAGSAPVVLAAAVAAATSVIRVGTGGVMLPNHQPLVVAEQFGVLASLFPGRIDMGLGSSIGFTDGIRRALGRDASDAEEFEARLTELLDFFRGPDGHGTGGSPAHPGVHAHPAEGLRVPAYVLATGSGADIAARAGLPLVISGFQGRDRMLAAIDRYREGFRAAQPESGAGSGPGTGGEVGARSGHPRVIYSGTVAVAATEEAARRLLVSEAWALAHSRTHGVFPPLAPAGRVESTAMTARERGFYESALRGHIAGTEEQVAAELESVLEATEADEVLVTTSAYERDALLDSYRRLAGIAGTAAGPPTPSERLTSTTA